MNIIGLHDRISSSLGTLKNKVTIENNSNNLGINITLETTYIRILNELRDLELINANLIQKNYPGIDAIDEKNRIAVQITATAKNEKIEHTVDQIIKSESYKDFDKLMFVFLKEKNKLSKTFIQKIETKIDGKFKIDFDNDLIEPDDIYNIIINKQDINKSLKVKSILDEVLAYLPTFKVSGFDFVGVSFDDEEFSNAIILIDTLVKSGFNVIINSKKVYSHFESNNHKAIDYLIYSDANSNIDFIEKYFVIISNKYIKKNIDSNKVECPILNSCIQKSLKPQIVSFTNFLDNIQNKNFRNPKSISKDNVKKIEEIINNLFYEKPTSKYTFEEIEELLSKLYPSYKISKINPDKTFSLYNLKMVENDNELNYLIFSHEYKRNEVINEYEEKYKTDFRKNLNVLIPKDYNQSTELRIKFIKDKFNYAKVVSYIDEFLFDKSLKEIKQSELLNNDNFIQPLFKIDDGFEKINDIVDWVKNDSSTQVAFIKGAGGIGKTTVSEKIHDEIIKNIDNNIVIFINASSYIEEIKRREKTNNTQFDLFTIFELCHNKAKTIDINIFKSNFILGNITVIIDGIDEIISTLPNFNLKNFVDDFQNLKEQIGRGKLIINSRDLYIYELQEKDIEFSKKYKVFELLKFDRENAEKYFEKTFPKLNGKTNKKVMECFSILDEFYEDSKDKKPYIYSPFVLEIIVLIVENDFEYEHLEHDFDSKILLKNYNNDYLIYKICQREIAKKELNGFIPKIDDFIKFLCIIAVEKNGIINDDDFVNYLRMIEINLSSEKVKDSLKDNPFLIIEKNKKYNFRFDFYNSVFKLNAIYAKLFEPKSFSLTDSFIEVISAEFKHNSLIFKALKKKIKKKGDELNSNLQKVKNLINEIREYKKNDPNYGFNYLKNSAISNLLLFILCINEKEKTSIEIIKEIFSDQNVNSNMIVLNNLYLIDIPADRNFIFDFTDIFFSNCFIENYPEFIYCTFSNDTYFSENCKISNITPSNIDVKLISASKNNFDDKIITNDNSLFRLIKLKEEGGESPVLSIKRFFKSFYSTNNNRINLEVNYNVISDGKKYCIAPEEIIQILMKNKIINSFQDNKVFLNKDFSSKIDKYLNQNIPFIELNKSLAEIDKKRSELK